MKGFLILFYCIFLSVNISAQNVNAIIQEGERLETALNEKGAFEKYKEAIRIQPTNIHALTKCSELCSRIGNRETVSTSRTDYYSAAQKFAAIALKLDETNASANCAMAIALGRVSLEKSGKEKVNAAKEIKKYADAALKSDPNHYKAWHVMGRWYYEVSNLNFFEKAAIKLLFGGMPKASFADAVKAFEKAKSLSPNFVLNDYELAKAYKKTGQKDKAIACLEAMLLQPDRTEDDKNAKANGRKLLDDLK